MGDGMGDAWKSNFLMNDTVRVEREDPDFSGELRRELESLQWDIDDFTISRAKAVQFPAFKVDAREYVPKITARMVKILDLLTQGKI